MSKSAVDQLTRCTALGECDRQFIHNLCFKLLLSKVKFHAISSVGMSDNLANQSSQLNLFQNESWCATLEMSFSCMFILLQI